MDIPIELIVTVVVSVLGGSLIPLVGIWLQSRQKTRELSLRHEEVLYQKRLDLATELSRTCYQYMAISHQLKDEKDEEYKDVLLREFVAAGKQIQDHESQVVLLFPPNSVKAFRRYWREIDNIRLSKDIPWTAVGSDLDEAYARLIDSMREDLGIASAEQKLTQSLHRRTSS